MTAVTTSNSQAAHDVMCQHCNKSTEKLSKCAQCHIEQYCSKDCQITQWPRHKKVCKLLQKKYTTWVQNNSSREMKTVWGAGGFRKVAPLLPRFFSSDTQGRTAIDLGSGIGMSSIHLLKRGWQVIAVDYSPELLNDLRTIEASMNQQWLTSGQLRIVQQDVLEYQFPENVDLIIANDILPYLSPLRLGELWHKIYGALNEDGALIGSLFQDGSVCERLYGAWTLTNKDMIKSILHNGPYKIEHCDFRQRANNMPSDIIEFFLKKTQTH